MINPVSALAPDILSRFSSAKRLTAQQERETWLTDHTFVDYGTVMSPPIENKAIPIQPLGKFVNILLHYKINGLPVILTNVEVLELGTMRCKISAELLPGDEVILFASKTVLDSVRSGNRTMQPSYGTSSLKCLPIATTNELLPYSELRINALGQFIVKSSVPGCDLGSILTNLINTMTTYLQSLSAAATASVPGAGAVALATPFTLFGGALQVILAQLKTLFATAL